MANCPWRQEGRNVKARWRVHHDARSHGRSGPDAAKFFFLMRRSDSHLDFDLDLAKQQSAENPCTTCNMPCAPVESISSRGGAGHRRGGRTKRGSTCPADPDELRLIRKLSAYPSVCAKPALLRLSRTGSHSIYKSSRPCCIPFIINIGLCRLWSKSMRRTNDS